MKVVSNYMQLFDLFNLSSDFLLEEEKCIRIRKQKGKDLQSVMITLSLLLFDFFGE